MSYTPNVWPLYEGPCEGIELLIATWVFGGQGEWRQADTGGYHSRDAYSACVEDKASIRAGHSNDPYKLYDSPLSASQNQFCGACMGVVFALLLCVRTSDIHARGIASFLSFPVKLIGLVAKSTGASPKPCHVFGPKQHVNTFNER